MKVLLTGASGFVGSHVLDRLLERQIRVAVLLRPSSRRDLIADRLASVDVCLGGIEEDSALDAALDGVTHIIHCAGATKALDREGFFAVNEAGTRRVVEAMNRRGGQIQRLVHISSLAAAGPATADRPRAETDAPAPVSDYGRSKLAGEQVVRERCGGDWTIIRPPAVYGPRDGEFLRLFKAVRSHVRPRFGGGRQQLTLVYVEDLAEAIVTALTHPQARREVFFAGNAATVTARELTDAVAAAAGTWSAPLPLPNAVLWLACQWAGLVSRLTQKADVLNAQKYAELSAAGWVCDVRKISDRLGRDCPTGLAAGLEKTQTWYRGQGWLPL
jgi:nucleoside-diphosphate-sugar epimerase